MMRVNTLAIVVTMVLLSISHAAADNQKAAPADSARHQKTGDPSFKEMLEFLGQWETDDGNWIDPTDTDWLLSPNQGSKNDQKKQK